MKLLHIVESAYRGTVEEQDDTILWLSASLRSAGAHVDILLRGNAVNYALGQQYSAPVSFGNWTQRHVPDVHSQLQGLHATGATVYACAADITDRGILKERLFNKVTLLSRSEIASLIEDYDRILSW